MATTYKHSNFVREPIFNKDVTAIPGVGASYAKRLSLLGITKAVHMLGTFLALGETNFDAFLKDLKMQKKFADQIKQGIIEWMENNL